jgi:hypothetical protein
MTGTKGSWVAWYTGREDTPMVHWEVQMLNEVRKVDSYAEARSLAIEAHLHAQHCTLWGQSYFIKGSVGNKEGGLPAAADWLEDQMIAVDSRILEVRTELQEDQEG